MSKTELAAYLDKLAHDLRNPVHTAQLNLEAAQAVAAKWPEAQAQRLHRHLEVVAAELQKLKTMVIEAAQQLKA